RQIEHLPVPDVLDCLDTIPINVAGRRSCALVVGRALSEARSQRRGGLIFHAEHADLVDEARDVFLAHDAQLVRGPSRSTAGDRARPKLRDDPETQQEMLHVPGKPFADRRIRDSGLIAVLPVDAAVAREGAIQKERKLPSRQLEDDAWDALLVSRLAPQAERSKPGGDRVVGL